MRLIILFTVLLLMSCSSRFSVTTNEIIQSSSDKAGVKSTSGKLLIDTIYKRISLMTLNDKLTLPPQKESIYKPTPIEFYQVENDANQLAVFNNSGIKVFDFVEGNKLQIDQFTKTVVSTKNVKSLGKRSQLYRWNGELLVDRDFENIAYIDHSELIALIAEDAPKEEFYLFNSFTNKELGPFSHFNIFGETSSPLLGMKENDFLEYKKLNIITVRTKINNEYVWGVIDLKGNEILPIEYKYIRVIDEGMRKRFIDRAEKPENINFLFYSYKMDKSGTMLFFDEKLNTYRYDQDARTIQIVLKKSLSK